VRWAKKRGPCAQMSTANTLFELTRFRRRRRWFSLRLTSSREPITCFVSLLNNRTGLQLSGRDFIVALLEWIA